MEKDIQKILLTEEQIQERIAQLGEVLTAEYADKNPVIVGVLKGVVVYKGTNSSGMTVRQDITTDIKGRHVLILEDIFDTGNSLSYTVEHLKSKEPASLKICTLLDKPERRNPGVTLQADYVGFTIPNEFVVGYGLDYNEKYRNLPFVGILKPEVYEK